MEAVAISLLTSAVSFLLPLMFSCVVRGKSHFCVCLQVWLGCDSAFVQLLVWLGRTVVQLDMQHHCVPGLVQYMQHSQLSHAMV